MMNIGFIGIGLMGFPMSKNLIKSGYNLKAYNRSQDKADRLKEFGAEISLSIKEVVTNVRCELLRCLQTMLRLRK